MPLDGFPAITQDFFRRLHDRVRRQSPVLAGKTHAPARAHHADAERFRRRKLRREQVSRAVWEDIVMVKAGRAAVFHQFAHAAKRAKANGVLIEIRPDIIQRGEPVKQLQILHMP